jgi:hypothetical protein
MSPHASKNDYYQKEKIIGTGEDVEKRELLHTVDKNVN